MTSKKTISIYDRSVYLKGICKHVRSPKQCPYSYRATIAPRSATTPTKKPEDLSERAPLLLLIAPAVDAAADEDEVSVATAVTAGALDAAADAATAVMSCGIIIGAPFKLLKETDPSSLITSGLAAKKVRVNITFSAKASCAQSGIAVMSIEEPQAAAALLFAVTMFAYACIAVIEELLAIIVGSVAATEPSWPWPTLGGLIMPNIPFSQWPGVPQ